MMGELLTAYLALTYWITIILGFLQAPSIPITDTPQVPQRDPAMYGIIAVFLIGVQASVTVIALGGTSVFPLGALLVAVTLLSHHTIIHRYSRFEGENCSCAPFQCKDVSNHETWIVAAIVAGLVSLLGL